MGAGGRSARQDEAARLQELLHRMEPQLRLLEGAVAVLRALWETADSLEPIVLASLARLAEEPVDQLTTCWQEALDAARGR